MNGDYGQVNGSYLRDAGNFSATIGTAAMSQDATRSAEIPRYSEELEKLLEACHIAVEQLDARLSVVSRSDPPQEVMKGCTTPTAVPQCSHGNRLQNMCATAQGVLLRVQGITRRLEV